MPRSKSTEPAPDRIRRLILRQLARGGSAGLTRHWLAGAVYGPGHTGSNVDAALAALVADGTVERFEESLPARSGVRIRRPGVPALRHLVLYRLRQTGA